MFHDPLFLPAIPVPLDYSGLRSTNWGSPAERASRWERWDPDRLVRAELLEPLTDELDVPPDADCEITRCRKRGLGQVPAQSRARMFWLHSRWPRWRKSPGPFFQQVRLNGDSRTRKSGRGGGSHSLHDILTKTRNHVLDP